MTEFPEKVINYPFGAMDVQSKAYAAAIEIEVENQKTLVEVAELTGALTLTAVASTELRRGAELIVKFVCDTTARAITLGTGFTGANIQGVASKTIYASFFYNGSSFVLLGTQMTDAEVTLDVQAKDYAASIAIAVVSQKTLVNIAQLTGAVTLTATIGANVKAGAELYVKLQSDGTARDATLSTGFIGATVAGTISKTKYASFVYDGTNFIHIATNQVN